MIRLIHKTTLILETFLDENAPPFIILSHRWSRDECTLQDFAAECGQDKAKWSAGTAKVMAFCEYVRDRAEEYVWVDTCCINKASSSELQEAINSMYKWYHQAALCVVYISDVSAHKGDAALSDQIAHSQWWTRGWTLQELLAPQSEVFVNHSWQVIGWRDELASSIESITGIPMNCLTGDTAAIHATPVAQRMSWMSSRRTTVTEDAAYCLLGIFDINMNMLYGEGNKAFLRLQTEIMHSIDDETLFLWTCPSSTPLDRSTILAPSPACFAGFQELGIKLDTYFYRAPCRATARGVELELYDVRSSVLDDQARVPLNCQRTADGHRPFLQLQHSRDPVRGVWLWKRIGHERVDAMDSSKYAEPPSEQQTFLAYERDMLINGNRGFGNQQPPGFGGGPPSHHHQVFGFVDEAVRRKIFVR